jgi:beta-phosphoglucomutase-like phosphatase (HAD superfamily)
MEASSNPPAFLFDLDGTLVDSVYQHVLGHGAKPWSAPASSSPCGASTGASA